MMRRPSAACRLGRYAGWLAACMRGRGYAAAAATMRCMMMRILYMYAQVELAELYAVGLSRRYSDQRLLNELGALGTTCGEARCGRIEPGWVRSQPCTRARRTLIRHAAAASQQEWAGSSFGSRQDGRMADDERWMLALACCFYSRTSLVQL
jgi:hypothetical protein